MPVKTCDYCDAKKPRAATSKHGWAVAVNTTRTQAGSFRSVITACPDHREMFTQACIEIFHSFRDDGTPIDERWTRIGKAPP